MDIPYSNSDLEKVLCGVLDTKRLKIYESADFDKKYSINEFLQDENNFFIVYNGKPDMVGHWTVLLLHDDRTIEYFDSFGSKTSYKPTKIKKFFQKHGFTWIENKKQLQSKDSNYCGKYVVLRVLSRHVELSKFLDLFKNRVLKPDDIVNSLVAIEF